MNSDAKFQAIAVIESLKAGIPTRASTLELSDLRPTLTNRIAQDLGKLADGNMPTGRLLWGAYGQGKTHVLTTIEHQALEQGFAVSRISLSREVSCHQLFNFYGRVASALHLPDSRIAGVQRLLDKQTAEDLQASPIVERSRYIHPLPSIVLTDYFYATGEEQDRLYGDLVGTRIPIGELKRLHRAARGEAMPRFDSNFKATEHSPAYFGVMADIVQWAGYKGWVILIDEVELIGRLGITGRLQAYRNLHWLLNWSNTMPYAIYTVGVVASGLRDIWFGRADEPNIKGDRLRIPELANQKICKDVADEMTLFFQKAVSNDCPILEPLGLKDLVELLSRLVTLHSLAYGWEAHLDVSDLIVQVGDKPTRTHIRAALEALDLAFVYSSSDLVSPEVTGLVDHILDEQADFFTVPEEVE
jgi:hypothetical protein